MVARAQLAETLLRIFGGRERASEIVGDLLEQHGASAAAFWWAVLAIVFAMTWRWMAAIITAAVSMLFILTKYVAFFQRVSPYEKIPLTWGLAWMLAGLCAWSVVMLNVFRFGFRDRLSGVGFGMTMLLVASACFVWFPSAIYVAPVVVAIYVALCFGRRSLRAPFLCVLASALTYVGAFVFLMRFLRNPESGSPRLLAAEFFGFWFLSFVAEAWVLTRTRRWLLPRVQSA
jgi:hypothetical protein